MITNNMFEGYPIGLAHYEQHASGLRKILRFGMSILPLTNFDVFNAVYGSIRDYCNTCDGRGAFVTGEIQGDGHMTGWVESIESCNDCIGSEKCPGCMQPLALSFDLSAFQSDKPQVEYTHSWTKLTYMLERFNYEDVVSAMPFEGFTCLVCGWSFDPEKLQDDGDPNDDYYDDYPALDASDYFPDYDAGGHNLPY